ncbi:30S ribosomal protein S7 [PVC group bacterium (ex Bugula neritina AB1)]|nr:30S ribosomal protein S7 [PVC group bacterium (ex Bugula neritina AB1)]
MSRRRAVVKREVLPDPKFCSKKVSKFINMIMLNGKKSLAEKIVYAALDILDAKVKDETPLEVFETSLKNVSPQLEVKSRRVGGATYQVPCEVIPHRSLGLAMRWIISHSRSRAGQNMQEKLAAELLDAYNGTGASIKKKDDTHKMAEANKAFAHFRW